MKANSDPGCVFCDIAAGTAPATVLREWPDALAIVPRGGCTPGHVLVIPRVHVRDAVSDPDVYGAVSRRAAQYAATIGSDCNLAVNCGPVAGQTVWHLHVHFIPRRPADGLPMPWTPQQEAARAAAQNGATA
ncbi:HIT family protein [Streptomyces harbinensis]|uniref:HIT family protein n=1 Tax=Streptomyces harbinensis TaxID=1176198 RepID=UPI0034DE7270